MSSKFTSVPKDSMSNQNQKMDIEIGDDQSKGFLSIGSDSESINSTGQPGEHGYLPNVKNETEISDNPHSPGKKDSQESKSEREEEEETLKSEPSESNTEKLVPAFLDVISRQKLKKEEWIDELSSWYIEQIFPNMKTRKPEWGQCPFIQFIMSNISVDSRLYLEHQIKTVSSKSPSQDFTRICNELMIYIDFEFRKRPGPKSDIYKKIKGAYLQGDAVSSVLQNIFREDRKQAINYFLKRKGLFMTVFQLGVVEKVLEELNSKTQTEFRTTYIAEKLRKALIENPSKIPIDQLEIFLREVSTIDCYQNTSDLHENLLELKGFLIIFLEECEKNEIGLEEYVLQTHKRQLRRLIRYVEDRIARLKIPIIQFTESSIVSLLKLIA